MEILSEDFGRLRRYCDIAQSDTLIALGRAIVDRVRSVLLSDGEASKCQSEALSLVVDVPEFQESLALLGFAVTTDETERNFGPVVEERIRAHNLRGSLVTVAEAVRYLPEQAAVTREVRRALWRICHLLHVEPYEGLGEENGD